MSARLREAHFVALRESIDSEASLSFSFSQKLSTEALQHFRDAAAGSYAIRKSHRPLICARSFMPAHLFSYLLLLLHADHVPGLVLLRHGGGPGLDHLLRLSLVASAAAFAPAPAARSATTLSVFESELGAQPPLEFYDPLGLLDRADQETFDRLRYIKLKHGQISQLAFLGQITTRAGLHLPGDIDRGGHAFASFPDGLAAINGPDAISTAGLLQITGLVAILEIRVMTDITGDSEFRGDFRNGFDFSWDKPSSSYAMAMDPSPSIIFAMAVDLALSFSVATMGSRRTMERMQDLRMFF